MPRSAVRVSEEPVRVAVVADTHLRAASGMALADVLSTAVEQPSIIIHAGDVVEEGVLRALGTLAPTFAVLGNNDRSLAGRLPDSLVLDLAGVRVAVVHDSGAKGGRPDRLRRRFPDAAVVVFGHSHVPVDEAGEDGQWLLNPGSPTQRRMQPQTTVGYLELGGGAVLAHGIIAVPRVR